MIVGKITPILVPLTGVPMSHVEFKKWQCPVPIFCNIHVDFKIV